MVTNNGCNLNCANGRASAVLPPGSWRTSCRNGYISDSILHAECLNGNGSWQTTSLDLRRCRGPLGNSNGNLVCQGGVMNRRD